MLYKKVRSGDKIRYIDNNGIWFKEEFNGKFKPSKPMPITKDYGEIELNIVDEGVYGLRVM